MNFILKNIVVEVKSGTFDYKANKKYFVTGFDSYSLKRGLEILAGMGETLELKKVLFSKNISYEEEEYFNYLALGTKVKWDDETIYFPLEQGDQGVIIENQMVQKIKFKKLTTIWHKEKYQKDF